MGNFRENRMDQNATKKEPYDPKQKKELLIGSISHSKPKRISHIKFGMLSGADMVRAAEIQVCARPLYHMGTREPVMNGVLDPRLGVSDKTSLCATCNQKLSDCTGHFGYIRLELPVFHIGYYKALQNVLQCVCKDCSRILLPPAERAKYLKSMTNPSRDSNQRANLRKKIIDLCKRNVICHCCGSVNGVVKKISGAASLKLIHEKYKSKKFINNEELFEEYRSGLETAIESNAEILQHVEKAQESLNPKVVLDILSEIPDEDLPLLWADPVHSRPERMVLTHIMVPPVAIRPSVKMDAGQGSNEDDLSVKLQEIVQFNHALQQKIQQGATMKVVQEYWDFLQVQVAQFFNGELPGLPPAVRANKPIRGLVQRMKGKQGRFRGNLSGKRVDFSGRTVISPDPNLSVHQVGVPVLMSMRLTYPEVVTRYNKEKLQELVIRGAKEYPGANYVRQDMGKGYTKMLEFIEDRRDIAQGLRYGDIVERHLEDGDIVLFNRQPSLHKMSIMSHVIKVLPGRTLRFNECVCAPYNADFDGDEMNLHVPQTEEARTEALELMGVRHNLITPRNGEPLVCATQDFITASYLMTQKDVFLTRDQVCQVASYLGDAAEHVELPEPTILKPVRLWTGKQIWGMLLNPRPSESYEQQTLVNLEAQERHYVGDPKEGNCMCPLDGYVIFRNSELICGQLGKGVLGGSKSGLVYVLIRDHGHLAASKGMNRMTKCVTRWLSESGFTIGIDDVTPDETLLAGKHKAIQYGYDEVDKIIAKYDNGTLETRPGCNLEESLESEVSRILNEVRDKAGKMCMQNLPRDNKPFIMATCGSKGSALNICQMVACVGQQIVGGSRMPNGFMRRSLPHFHLDAKDPSAKGFVANSFYSGLNPPEFFFHTMGGREGLVDTAVKTAETGYMARRLMKALEDLSIRYDGSVRNSSNGVVQFTYGDDGLNPACMEKGDRPVNFTRLLNHVCASLSCGDEAPLSGDVIRTLAKSEIERHMQVVKDFRATQTAVGRLKRSHAVSSGEKVESLYINNKLLVNGALVNGIEFFLEELGSALDNIASQIEDMEKLVKQDPDAQVVQQVLSCARRVTKTHLSKFIDAAIEKYQLAVTEPGEAVGAIGAQSLGEPGTQMTLKTFHFAGVASMNVTLGVPRIKEIINASKLISTPIITVGLDCNNDERSARIVKGRIERTTLGEVADFIEERYTVDGAYIEVQLSAKVIRNLHLDITPDTVRSSILNSAKLKLGPDNISLKVLTGGGSVVVRVPNDYGEKATRTRKLVAEAQHNLFYSIQMLKAGLQQVIVQGIPSVQRAVVNIDEGSEKKGSKRYHLLVEGLGLQHVMGIPGVNGKKTRTNHIMEMEKVLGIEAARKLVMEEVDYIFKQYGLGIDVRHLMLLADVMSYRGQILGITRFGIAKMKESVLMLASFEKTSDHLFDAAVHSRQDEINGVSECIIMGTPIPLGTGSFKLLSTWDSALHKENGLGLQIRNTIDL